MTGTARQTRRHIARQAGTPVEEVSLKITAYREGLLILSYRVMLDIRIQLALFVAELVAAPRRQIGTRREKARKSAGRSRSAPPRPSSQRDRVLGYVDKGRTEGARLVAGGGPALAGLWLHTTK